MNDTATYSALDAAEELVGILDEAKFDLNVALEHHMMPPKEAFLRYVNRVDLAVKTVTANMGSDWKLR